MVERPPRFRVQDHLTFGTEDKRIRPSIDSKGGILGPEGEKMLVHWAKSLAGGEEMLVHLAKGLTLSQR